MSGHSVSWTETVRLEKAPQNWGIGLWEEESSGQCWCPGLAPSPAAGVPEGLPTSSSPQGTPALHGKHIWNSGMLSLQWDRGARAVQRSGCPVRVTENICQPMAHKQTPTSPWNCLQFLCLNSPSLKQDISNVGLLFFFFSCLTCLIYAACFKEKSQHSLCL